MTAAAEPRREGNSVVDGMGPLPCLIDITGLAGTLGTTVRHVRRLVAEKQIPYIKVGHLVRFDPADVACWLEERSITVHNAENPDDGCVTEAIPSVRTARRTPPASTGRSTGRPSGRARTRSAAASRSDP